ncbi:MAG: TetR/AcrR family transcriptional regulator [Lawsonibacter sp.]|nr:TetR/AcrR family transcriptional regulator [Lawsonibacter sp.]MCI8914435.1 TetR/AcrR family transcriptional regulator [Lawsonibacter sp.]
MAKKPSTKNRIITAAWQLFREKGYDETTIEDIISLSETSKGTFYHYFSGKDSLLSSLSDLFDSYYEELLPQLDSAMNTVDKLVTLCCKAHRMIGDSIQPELLASLYSSQVVTKGDKHLLNQNRFYYHMIYQLADEGIRRGDIRSDLSVREIARIFAMCERAIVYDYCISGAAYDLGDYTAQMIPLLLEGIRAPGKKTTP